MPVATMLAIAASFWGSHGYTVTQPVTWDWAQQTIPGVQAYVDMTTVGGVPIPANHIYLMRSWWDRASNQERCVVVVHEMGHAAFSFEHRPNSIMSAYNDETRPVPGVCKRSKAGWRAAARSI